MNCQFTDAELQQIETWAKFRDGNHQGVNTQKVDPRRSSIDVNRLGVKGEYAVWQRYGGEHLLDAAGPDPGWDVKRDGVWVQVKTNQYEYGDFYLKPGEQFTSAYGVLVVDGPGTGVTIKGWTTREEFERLAVETSYGYNTVRAMTQDQLRPPGELLTDIPGPAGKRVGIPKLQSKTQFYIAVDWESCVKNDHRITTAWSDKTPLKVNLICETCSLKTGKSAYVAYGDATKSWGSWRKKRRGRQEEPPTADAVEGSLD